LSTARWPCCRRNASAPSMQAEWRLLRMAEAVGQGHCDPLGHTLAEAVQALNQRLGLLACLPRRARRGPVKVRTRGDGCDVGPRPPQQPAPGHPRLSSDAGFFSLNRLACSVVRAWVVSCRHKAAFLLSLVRPCSPGRRRAHGSGVGPSGPTALRCSRLWAGA